MNCSTPGLPVHHQLPGVYANSCPLSWWCHPTISSPVVPFSSSPQSFPASGSFQISQLIASGDKSIGVSALKSGLPVNTQDWSLSGWRSRLDLLAVQGTVKSLLQHHSSNASILRRSPFFIVQLSHLYMTTGKTIALTRRTSVGKVISLLLNILSRLVITFLPRSKRLLISWLQSSSAVILEPQKIKSDTVSRSCSTEQFLNVNVTTSVDLYSTWDSSWKILNVLVGASLVVQWLRPHASTPGGTGSYPD